MLSEIGQNNAIRDHVSACVTIANSNSDIIKFRLPLCKLTLDKQGDTNRRLLQNFFHRGLKKDHSSQARI